jgi:hypothetical protein
MTHKYCNKNSNIEANMKKVIGPKKCLPGSNAFVETVFSEINYIWGNEKSQIKVDTIRAIIGATLLF